MSRSLIVVLLLVFTGNILSQTLQDFISEIKGDTLVIKDYVEMGDQPNSLYYALALDTVNVPAGRVYELRANGYYPLTNTISNHMGRNIEIVGDDFTPVVNNKDVNSAPPVICVDALNSNNQVINGFELTGNLTIKNCTLTPSRATGQVGWTFINSNVSDLQLYFDNCIMEHTRWTFVSLNQPHCNIVFRNCYFLNTGGYSYRGAGGVFDSFVDQDTLIVENCTHVRTGSFVYKLRENHFKRTIFNHNTFINCVNLVFYNLGLLQRMSLTSNLFINCNLTPHDPVEYDWIGTDYDHLPVGLVNVYQDGYEKPKSTTRKYLVQGNLVYWAPVFDNCDSIIAANHHYGVTNWQSQKIIMNSRSQQLFDDNINCPFLVTDNWINEMPEFTESQNLFTDQLINIKNYIVGLADTNSEILPDWRLLNTGPDRFVYPDWPVPINLSYINKDLLTGGVGGYPIGDLNWFPEIKQEWHSQCDLEYENFDKALDTGMLITNVDEKIIKAENLQLYQNYPNPFNPVTTISYNLPMASRVILDIYNINGQKIVTLVDGMQFAGIHHVKFNGSSLANGVYFYHLQSAGNVEHKKMVLLK